MIERNAILLALALLSLGGCGGSHELTSQWAADGITVDGKIPEWPGHYQTIAGGKVDVGVINDSEYLYISIFTIDQATLSQIMRQGLVVWLNGQGKKEKRFGIHYPLGMTGGAQSFDLQEVAEQTATDREDRMEMVRRSLAENLHQLELKSGERGLGKRMSVENLQGFDLAVDVSWTRFSYEMKIPLHRSGATPFALDCRAGDELAICIETPQGHRQEMSPMVGIAGGIGRRGSRPPGGMGGRPGGGMGGARPGDMQPPEPFEEWITTALAKKP